MMTIESEIFDMVDRQNHVTFAELSRIEGFAGDLTLCKRNNLFLWSGVSEEAADAIDSLIAQKKIHFYPTTPLTYLIDGMSLSLPIAKRIKDYTKPHWLPVVLNRGAPPLEKALRRRK